MERQLSKVGWKAEFFRAIRPQEAAGFPSSGARGCFLSHLSVLKKAQNTTAECIVILEDDLNFVPTFVEKWQSVMSVLATREWSIFYPGPTLNHLPAGLSRLAPEIGVQCTHFMVFHRSVLPILIAGLETILSRPPGHRLGGPMHVDGAYSTLRAQRRELITYAYYTALGYQRSSRTDVGKLKWFDRLGILERFVRLARGLRQK